MYKKGGQAPMSEFKRITRKEIRAEWNKSWNKQDTSAELDQEEMLVLEDILDAQLASCEKEQEQKCEACTDGFISTHEKATNAVREQERRAIGEWLRGDDELWTVEQQGGRIVSVAQIQAFLRGTLPEGMVK
jgi:hypothetical protein